MEPQRTFLSSCSEPTEASTSIPSMEKHQGSHARTCQQWTKLANRPESPLTTPRQATSVTQMISHTSAKSWTPAAVALANEQVGGAQFVMDMAVQYAKDRAQFGRPIGSFQAIKHKCADMLLEVESAKSAAYYAMVCLRNERGITLSCFIG